MCLGPDWDHYPKRHQFPVILLQLFFDLVLSVATSLRAASGVLRLLGSRVNATSLSTPCANTGRMWILRVGLYEITRPKEQADDWVWIADHTRQAGAVKCLLIVGCRLREWQQNPHPLEHRDLQVLMLEPVEKSSGELIVEQFTRVAQTTGIPRAIISDGGADLQRGIMLYRQQNPAVAPIYDITHKLARFLHKVLTEDARWGEFLQAMSHSKKQYVRSSLAFLTPPLVRDQDRYMNSSVLR
jgi:hypothetical protein